MPSREDGSPRRCGRILRRSRGRPGAGEWDERQRCEAPGKAEEVVDKAEKDKALKMEAEAVMKKAKEEVEAMKMEVEEAKKKAEQEVATLSGWSGLVLMAGVIVRAFM
ncbi:hypothetical protein HYH03_012882 [Edaphochlamys debaryana]|uniref:Uncharacterized protein n=1 Tax=Edaphochlamys debaryana TaxID=47281 RepID=A0A836BV10_9CHLO|nr:hypothetical protein HYH03_012882 [Edaphochlamys debaryana]|eukprot:KAG2488563.1 hypothetical protein HYH03_012882 [Edaphochlamys debaryana]